MGYQWTIGNLSGSVMTLQELFEELAGSRSLPAGSVIFEAGDAGDEMYLIREGEVEIRTGERVLRTLGPGDLFGEMALISKQPRSATAVARTDCILLPVDERRFLFLVQQSPYFSLHVMETLAARLRSLS